MKGLHRAVPWCMGVFLFLEIDTAYCEKFRLDLYASKFDTIPIAILPFRPVQSRELTKNEPWKVIADDLEFSGRFIVVRATTIDSAFLREKNVGIYIDGEYREEPPELVVDCFLRDAVTGETVMAENYRCAPRNVRTVGHLYADRIVQTLLGERSIFLSKIVFVRDERTKKDLSIMDYDGENVMSLTNTSVINLFPAFADSMTVYFTSYLRGKPDIYRLSLGSSDPPEIFAYSRLVTTSPAISPIDGWVAYASSREGNMEIYVSSPDKTTVQRITNSSSIDTSPAWSPNGAKIAFCSDRGGNPQIYVMDRDGSNVKRLTFHTSWADAPAWSPRGDLIAYQAMQAGKFDIWVISPDSSTSPRRVTTFEGNNESPTWSADGLYIAYSCRRGASSDIWAIRPDGTGLRQISRLGNAKMPDWSKW